jgi:hypothetical protein
MMAAAHSDFLSRTIGISFVRPVVFGQHALCFMHGMAAFAGPAAFLSFQDEPSANPSAGFSENDSLATFSETSAETSAASPFGAAVGYDGDLKQICLSMLRIFPGESNEREPGRDPAR